MTVEDPSENCRGVLPLAARLEPWQRALLERPGRLVELLAEHGSPVNILSTGPMGRNADQLREAARGCGRELHIKFARKANRALCFVDEARRLGLGVDVASERELAQALARGVPAQQIIVTAAIKPEPLLRLCLAAGVTTAIDNGDELDRMRRLAAGSHAGHPIAMRLAVAGARETRFGLPADEILAAARRIGPTGSPLRIAGIHFHLDGYRVADRVEGIAQSLELVRSLRALGHDPAFVDIGGGVPMSYLDDAGQWRRFWRAHEAALLGRRAPLTFEGHPLGLSARDGKIAGTANVYPAHQDLVRAGWMRAVLDARLPGRSARRGSVSEALGDCSIELHCEPGRALLDGCGLTVARVEFRKRRRAGGWFIGLEMNRTQVRSAADDFLVDPLLVPAPGIQRTGDGIEGYLVGAYCIERELLTWRRLVFPRGVEVGDMVVFPNTAGYLMHILESQSHRIPLAANLCMAPDGTSIVPDPGG